MAYLLSPATVLMKICMVSTASADEARDSTEESLLMLLMLLERAILLVVVGLMVSSESVLL